MVLSSNWDENSVLFSTHLMSSVLIGVVGTGTVVIGVGSEFFSLGEGGVDSGVSSVSCCGGFCIWILNGRELVSYIFGSS